MGDKCKLMRPKEPRMRDKRGRQGGDKCKLMRPKEPSVGDKGETSVNSCGHKALQSGRQVWETSVSSCGPRHPEWETRGRQV